MEMKTDKIHRYIWRGRNDINWYQECEQLIIDRYGKQDARLVAKLLAATSINSSMKSNVTLFKKAYAAIKNNKPIPKMLPNIMTQIESLIAYNVITGRKINSFANAMSGDTQAVVVDVWLLRAFHMDRQYKRHTGPHAGRERSGGATDKQYTQIEDWVRNEAFYMGLEPRQLCAMVWSGIRTATNGKDKTHYKQVLIEASMELFPRVITGFNATEVSMGVDSDGNRVFGVGGKITSSIHKNPEI